MSALINLPLDAEGAVRLASAAKASIERMRKACRETDAQFGKMNNMYRDAIHSLLCAHRDILARLREAGWPMTGEDIADDEIDRYLV